MQTKKKKLYPQNRTVCIFILKDLFYAPDIYFILMCHESVHLLRINAAIFVLLEK